MSTSSDLGKRYAFGVCRIEPENNIHMILEAFESDAAMQLVMVGNWQRGSYGIGLKQKFSSCQNISLLDPIYDQTKLNELRATCTLYLHGHSCGGTNPSLVEALYLGLPIAAFDVEFNRVTSEGKALYFRTSTELRQLVNSTPVATLCQIAATMREIACRRYTWSRIAALYAEIL